MSAGVVARLHRAFWWCLKQDPGGRKASLDQSDQRPAGNVMPGRRAYRASQTHVLVWRYHSPAIAREGSNPQRQHDTHNPTAADRRLVSAGRLPEKLRLRLLSSSRSSDSCANIHVSRHAGNDGSTAGLCCVVCHVMCCGMCCVLCVWSFTSNRCLNSPKTCTTYILREPTREERVQVFSE